MKRNKRIENFIATLLLSAICFVAVMAVMGIYPFGDNSFLTGDLNGIYIPEYSYVKDILEGRAKWGFAFNKALGGNTTGMFAYYTSSPLLILLLLFKKRDFVLLASLLFALKVILGAGFFDLYLTKKFKALNNYDIVLSLCFAFMQYTFAYYQNIMWLDCVVMLPLILLGLEKIFEGESPLLYCVSLALCTWGNFYIAVMCCIFVAMYFAWQYIDRYRFSINKKVASRFVLSSLGGGLLPMAMLLPSVVQIFNSKSVGEGEIQRLDYNIFNLSRQFILGYFDSENMMKGMPFIYGGLILAVGVCFYFSCRQIDRIKKLFSAVVGAVLVASFLFTPLNLLFHGMTQTVWFPHRHAFLFVAYCIILVADALQYKIEKSQLMTALTFSVFLLACQLLLYRDTISKKNMLLGFVLLVIFSTVPHFIKERKVAVPIVLIVTMAELVFNSCGILKHLELYSVSDFRSQYDYMEQVKELASQHTDDNFYRIERDYFRTLNDPLLYGYNGISHFDSTQDKMGSTLKRNFGYNEYNLAVYRGTNNIAADCLLNIKFTLSKENSDYSYKKRIADGVYMYPDTMPFVCAIDDNGDFSDGTMAEYINGIYRKIAGEELTVVYPKGSAVGDGIVQDQYLSVDINAISTACKSARGEDITYSVDKNKIDISYNNTDKKYLLITIPYDENWQILTNGEKTDGVCAFSAFMAVPVFAGENHITMVYRPRGVVAGCCLSFVGFMLTAGVTLLHKREKFIDY